MTEEQKQKFRELFPECTVKDSEVCLSPYIDIFEAGIEIATKELQEEVNEWKTKFEKLERKCRFNFTDLLEDVEKENKQDKQIQIDAEQIRALQKQNGELTDKVRDLEAQVEKMNIELAQALEENKLLKSLLYCTKRSCNNCGKVTCENFQRQRIDCCEHWVSYKDYIKDLETQIEEMKCCEDCNNFMHRIDHRCNTKCKNLSEWEIKEK